MNFKNKLRLLCLAMLLLVSNSFAQTQQIKGLVVLVSFLGDPFPEPEDSVAMMMNQTGFSGWGNQGSVKDYFYTQSNGKLEFTHTVIKVALSNPISYYRGGGGRDLSDIVDAINAAFPAGFTDLTLRPDGSVYSFTILTKVGGGAWEFGPQPGSNTIKNNGVNAYVFRGNITNYNSWEKPSYNTICHEMGHCVFRWPDHYQTAWSNLGNYCLMASAGNNQAPQMINPALRLQKGWIDNVIEIGNRPYDTTITAASNSYTTVYKYTNPNNPKEYLLVYPVVYGTYFQERLSSTNVADQGLAIYYVDEDGGMELPGQESAWQVKLIQADNKDDLHDEGVSSAEYLGSGLYYTPVRGDYNDLYDNVKNSFPAGTPFRWKDGGEFGLLLGDISAPGATMTFTVYSRGNTYIAKSDNNGTITPKGVLSSVNQTFTFTPYPGYEINTVKVNGNNVTPTGNQYTVNGVGNKTIEVSYKRKSPEAALPSPWTKTDVGTTSVTGFAAFDSGSFYLESYGNSIDYASDNFTFVYQTLYGDGSIVARVKEYKNPSREESKFGVMIRESLASNAALAMISKRPTFGIKVQQRTASGYDLGSDNGYGSEHLVELYTWLKLTRTGNTITSHVSKDGFTWIKKGEQTIYLPAEVKIGIFATGHVSGYPARAVFDNVEVTGVSACPNGGGKLTGTPIGTPGSYYNYGNTHDKAFDGDIYSFFDADASDDVAWTGLSLGGDYTITGIRFYPRYDYTDRMVGGKFQGSNVADFSTGVVDLVTLSNEPNYDWNCVPVINTATFKYVRYISPSEGWGNVAEIEFYGTGVASNVAPTISITSPSANASFVAPASVNITANASDADGTISKVEFFVGTTLVATDYTAPYSYTWNTSTAGAYTITAKATDNDGASTSASVTISVTALLADINGPACGSNYATLSYEVESSKRTNATSYNWWYTGNAQSVNAVSGSPYQVHISTGNNFQAGQLCVGINYSGAPYYASYCISLSVCSGSREESAEFMESKSEISYQNPFTNSTMITFPNANQMASIEVLNGNGHIIEQTQATGAYEFGNELKPGFYIVKISFEHETKVVKLVKE
jgi:M6 family metalloprotease-like protein